MATYYMRQLRDDFRMRQMNQLVGGGGLGWLNKKEFAKTNPKRVYSRGLLDENAGDFMPRTNIQSSVAHSVNENRKFDITPKDPGVIVYSQGDTFAGAEMQQIHQSQPNIPIHQSTPYMSTM